MMTILLRDYIKKTITISNDIDDVITKYVTPTDNFV